jgi:hypothetical protein
MASDAATDIAPREFRTPRWMRVMGLVVMVFETMLTLGLIAAAVFIFRLQWAFGLVMLAPAILMGMLTGYLWRDVRAKWGLRVVLERDAVKLDLPANRSLIHRPKAEHLVVPYSDIEALETRLEAYRSMGMASMQRPYTLRLRNGELIFLFEERAIGTGMQSDFYTSILRDLVARARCPVRDLGMVEGKGGALAVWGAHAPEWSAPALPADRQRQLLGRVAGSGTAIMVVFAVIWLLGMLTW